MMSSIGHRRSWIVDIVYQDFEKYALDKDMDRVSRKLFFPTSIMLARKLAYEKEFDQAYSKIRDAELELIMSAEKENGQIDRVPDIKVILQEVVNSCDKETRSDFTSFIEDKIKCPLFDIYRKSKRVRDIMNKDDANEYANKMVPKDCVDNIHAEARFLNGIGCELQNEKRNIRAATKFFAAAIDLLETQIDETENFAVVYDEDLRRQISPQKYQSLSNIYQSLHVYYRNLFNAYTILWETDQMHKRMKGLERVSRNLALQDLFDYVACIGNILGGTEKKISLTYDK
ncbi:hypothetical protein FSP39_018695 [Pinctada imbricata]|uniref:Uncharacterized protein n=1 Tax=Pinctada imbricata TaxID=66713 RepID=A0AA88YDK5_PINIB|nr:hypothetical protein FSP39_018695 [Pinctada imbricata]